MTIFDRRDWDSQTITRRLAWAGAAIMLVWALTESRAGELSLVFVESACVAAFLLVEVLTRLRKFLLAKTWLLIVSNATVFLGVLLFERDTYGELPFLGLVGMPFLLFDQRHRNQRIAGTLMPVVLCIVSVSPLRERLSIWPVFPSEPWYIWANALSTALIVYLMTFFHGQADEEEGLITHRRLDESERTNRAWDEFASVVSHELKTPLTSLTLQVDLLSALTRRRNISDADYLKVLEDCRHSTRKLNELVSRLLDISRIRTGQLSLQLERMDLCASVREVVAALEKGGIARPGLIELDHPTELHGHWDRTRIEQVVVNLLTNAIKYGEDKLVKVTLSNHLPGGRVRLCVEDQGPGIPQDRQTRIFEKFERIIEPDRDVPGLGLGLFIVRNIVDSHQGSIRVESAPGKGAKFVVELPIERV